MRGRRVKGMHREGERQESMRQPYAVLEQGGFQAQHGRFHPLCAGQSDWLSRLVLVARAESCADTNCLDDSAAFYPGVSDVLGEAAGGETAGEEGKIVMEKYGVSLRGELFFVIEAESSEDAFHKAQERLAQCLNARLTLREWDVYDDWDGAKARAGLPVVTPGEEERG